MYQLWCVTLTVDDQISLSFQADHTAMSPPLFATQSKPLHIYASEVVRMNVSVYFFAQFGVLLRVLLTASMKTVDTSILPEVGGSFFLQNVVGCCFMGLFAGCAEVFTRAHLQFLQVGLAGGFCGSLTTFGGWVVAVAKEMLSSGHSQRINATLKVFKLVFMNWSILMLVFFCFRFCSTSAAPLWDCCLDFTWLEGFAHFFTEINQLPVQH